MTVDGIVVVGTDTGIGKTVVSAGLVAWLAASGRSVHPLKPVESGTDESGGEPADASLLAEAAGVPLESAYVFALPEPLAPVVAARRAGVELSMTPIDERVESLRSSAGVLVVEGVGGALVEVVPGVMVADLAVRWSLPALVVAGNRLGALSHTLMTVEALLSRGVSIRGVVLNTLAEGSPSTSEATNADELRRTLPSGVALLGVVPYVSGGQTRDPAALAAAVGHLAPGIFGLP